MGRPVKWMLDDATIRPMSAHRLFFIISREVVSGLLQDPDLGPVLFKFFINNLKV